MAKGKESPMINEAIKRLHLEIVQGYRKRKGRATRPSGEDRLLDRDHLPAATFSRLKRKCEVGC